MKNFYKIKRMLVTTVSVAVSAQLLLLSPKAVAQLALEEVVVTAQKREESVQDIPVSVTAIDAEAIEKLRLESSADIVRASPSLTVIESNNKTNSAFSIRGIGTNVFGTSAEQAVAMIIDDVAMPQQGQSMSNLMDIERIEVLRGPQSTLFGKAASAGAISIVTKGPSDEFEGTAEITLTDESMYKVAGSVSSPISDSLGYRISGYTLDRDGHSKSLAADTEDANGEEAYGVRAKFQWNISDTISADLIAYSSKEESQCCVRTWRDISPGALYFGFLPVAAFTAGITLSEENTTQNLDDLPNSVTDNSGGSLRLSVDLGEHTLLSITAMDEWDYSNTEDVDFTDRDMLAPLTRGAQSGGLVSSSVREAEFFSQEFRLLSPQNESYDYVAGLYYSDAETDRTFVRNHPYALSNNATVAGTEYLGVFGQLNWHLSDSTKASFGLRYFEEEIKGEFTNLLPATPTLIGGSAKDSDVVGKVSLTQQIGDNSMLFASFTRGYKGQMYDLQPQFSQFNVDNPVQPETSDAFEIGLKSQLFDNRVQLNLTAFKTNYENYQIQTVELVGSPPVAVFEVRNAGELITQGIELETVALLSESLTATFNAAFIDSEVNDLVGAACFASQSVAEGCVGGVQTVDGGTLPSSPETKFTLALDYVQPLGSTELNFISNLNYTWQDDVLFNINQDPDLGQKAYGITNLSFGVERQDGSYQITAFVNNLFDEFYVGDMIAADRGFLGTGTANLHLVPRNSQQYYGVKAKFNF